MAEEKLTLVSVIIPVYQVSDYVECCLLSVMNQTYKGIECIIVDDATEDDSIDKCERLIAHYSGSIKFRILHHEYNRGLSAARNTGTFQANGDYLYYLDSDDEITENCIETLLAKTQEYPGVEMVQGNVLKTTIDNKTILVFKRINCSLAVTNDEVRRCFYQNKQMNVAVWNKLLKRDFLIKNMIICREGILYEDQLWAFYLLKYISKACFIPDVTYKYKMRIKSISTSTSEKIKAINYNIIYKDVITHLTQQHEQEELMFFVPRINTLYIGEYRNNPIFQEVLLLFREKGQIYGSLSTRMRLELFVFIRNFKYGWVIWWMFLGLRYPGQIVKTIKRLR